MALCSKRQAMVRRAYPHPAPKSISSARGSLRLYARNRMLTRATRSGPARRIPVEDARPTLERLLEGILAFWDERLLDTGGGYALGHDVRGRPTGSDSMHVVSQART